MSHPLETRLPEARPIETPRLLLLPLTLEDSAQTQLIFPHWEVVRYLASQVPWPYPADGAFTYYRDIALPAMAARTEWHWTIRLKSNPATSIGAIGLFTQKDDNRGFWIGLSWQRQGVATEASDAVTAFWFNDLGFPLLRTSKAVANTASSRVSARTGMTLIRIEDRDYVSGRLPGEIWEITAEQWRARST